jgi:hypothetical protein
MPPSPSSSAPTTKQTFPALLDDVETFAEGRASLSIA